MRALALPWLLLAQLACSSEPRPEVEPARPQDTAHEALARSENPASSPRSDGAKAATKAPVLPAPAPARPGQPVPPRGCLLEDERVLAEGAQEVLVANDRGLLSVVILGQDGRSLSLYRAASPRTLAPTATSTLEAKAARMALYAGELGLRLAYVDEQGKVRLAAISSRAFAAPRTLADGADRRFAPAYAVASGAELVAFTRTVDEAMHTFLVRIEERPGPARDITPNGHGAAAPTFVLGEEPPVLVAIDAHAGVSPLLEIPLSERGEPGSSRVRTPVSQPYTPPALSAVRMPGGSDVQVAYTAVGKLAATAIGRVPLRVAAEPVALLPSRGYGELFFASARGERRVAFALESPRSEAADAPRSIELVLLDGVGEGPRLTIAGDGESARHPALAIGVGEGELWLGYARAGRATVSTLRCDM